MSEKNPQTTVVVTKGTKSAGVAILLAILFGPLGMLYSTVAGAIVMFLLFLVVGFMTGGLGLIVLWPIAIVWAAAAANGHNRNIIRQVQTR